MQTLMVVILLSGTGADHERWQASTAVSRGYWRQRFEASACTRDRDVIDHGLWCAQPRRDWARFCLLTVSRPTRSDCEQLVHELRGRKPAPAYSARAKEKQAHGRRVEDPGPGPR